MPSARKNDDGNNFVPQSKVELEWPSLQRMAADREHVLRCLLQFREGVPLQSEKEEMLRSYIDDKLFNEDLLMRQSQGAAAICAYVKRVFESAIRAKSRYGTPGDMDDQDPLWGNDDEDHETADVEQDMENAGVK